MTVLVGLLQFATGALRLGSVANFISPTALLGFTAGAALLIVGHALKDALGLAQPPGSSAPVCCVRPSAQRRSPARFVTLGVAAGLRHWRRGSPFMLTGLPFECSRTRSRSSS